MEKSEKFGLSLKCGELIILCVGAYLAIEALGIYKNQANIAFITNLQDTEKEIVRFELENPYLAALHADLRSPTNVLEGARQSVLMFLDCSADDQKRCAEFSRRVDRWGHVKDLDCALYETVDFHNPAKRKLRVAYLHAETILYTVARAFEGKQTRKLDGNDYDTYAAYVVNIGHNPLFLTAIYYGHTHGYITKDFSRELSSLLNQSDRAKEARRAVYPDFTPTTWSTMKGRSSCPAGIPS